MSSYSLQDAQIRRAERAEERDRFRAICLLLMFIAVELMAVIDLLAKG